MNRMSFTAILAVALSILGTHSVAAQTTQAFMRVPGIPGDSETDGREDWIDVLSVAQLFTGAEKKTGACTVSVTKALDRSTPLLFAAASTGQIFPDVVIEIVGSSEPEARPFYVLTLSDALISSISLSPTDSTENLTFTGESATLRYLPRYDGKEPDEKKLTLRCT